jgi:S-adenosylmethionine decarboxylase
MVENKDYFKRNAAGKLFAGTHVLLDIIGIQAGSLDDCDEMQVVFGNAVQAGGATLLHINLHKFQPNGVTGVAILSESHISVHTWPEKQYAAFDIFMCGSSDPNLAVHSIINHYNPKMWHIKVVNRGEGMLPND